MKQTTDRADLIAELLAPYLNFERRTPDGAPTVEWALVSGGAEFVADALLSNPNTDYWRNAAPLEDGGEGAAVKWLRETLDNKPGANAAFEAFGQATGTDASRETARIVRWLIERGFSAPQAIAYTSPNGDEPINSDFATHVRERLIRALPAHARAGARNLKNDWTD